ncbi:MAG: hypothetical protein GY696_24305, partial [Gammaproteobacteria bacterium]|nr:hypothetical protein [Gammaproteobacteria bacterium]
MQFDTQEDSPCTKRQLFQSTDIQDLSARSDDQGLSDGGSTSESDDSEKKDGSPLPTQPIFLVDDDEDTLLDKQCHALTERKIYPQFNCVPQKLYDRLLPRRKELPQISPDIPDATKAWSELRQLSQISAFRQNLQYDDSDSGIQTALSADESITAEDALDSDGAESPLHVLILPQNGEGSEIWSSRYQQDPEPDPVVSKTVLQCMFDHAEPGL